MNEILNILCIFFHCTSSLCTRNYFLFSVPLNCDVLLFLVINKLTFVMKSTDLLFMWVLILSHCFMVCDTCSFSRWELIGLQLFLRGHIKVMHKCGLMAAGQIPSINCGCKGIRTCLRCEAHETKQHLLQKNDLVSRQHCLQKRLFWHLYFALKWAEVVLIYNHKQLNRVLHKQFKQPFFLPWLSKLRYRSKVWFQ